MLWVLARTRCDLTSRVTILRDIHTSSETAIVLDQTVSEKELTQLPEVVVPDVMRAVTCHTAAIGLA